MNFIYFLIHLDLEANLSVNGKPMNRAVAAIEVNWNEPSWTSQLFHDSDRKIDSISKGLDLQNFFQLSWEDVNNDLVSVSCNTDCAAIVVAWEHNFRQDNLINILKDQDWLLKTEEQMSWVNNGGWSSENGKSKAVLSKGIVGGTILSFNRPLNDLPISVFVVQGKKMF